MGFREDAIAAADADRKFAAEAMAEAESKALEAAQNKAEQMRQYELMLVRRQRAEALAIATTWLDGIEIDPGTIEVTVSRSDARWVELNRGPEKSAEIMSYYHPAKTTLTWEIEGHKFRADITYTPIPGALDDSTKPNMEVFMCTNIDGKMGDERYVTVNSRRDIGEALR
jgi:hypothetical protein